MFNELQVKLKIRKKYQCNDKIRVKFLLDLMFQHIFLKNQIMPYHSNACG